MSAFTVELENRPRELARLCQAMASSGVNLLLCATTRGDDGVVALIAAAPDVASAGHRDSRWRSRQFGALYYLRRL